MLGPVAQAERGPVATSFLEGVERVPVRPVADRVHGDRPARAGSAPQDLDELLAARDLDPGRVDAAAPDAAAGAGSAGAAAVEQPGGPGAERPVHEHLQVAEPEAVVAEPRRDPELGQPVELLVRE